METNFMRFAFLHALFLGALMGSCQAPQQPVSWGKDTRPPSHAAWTTLLQKHVDSAGWVDYRGFVTDSAALNLYLGDLSATPPDATKWPKNEQLAYWINAYNAFTVKLIVAHYPINSITELHPTVYVPLLNTVWHREFFQIGGKPCSLDLIEHQILRKQFDEPRIHFAINCASVSCPPLRNEAFQATQLDLQLDEQARLFINDPLRNHITPDKVEISQIFSWFSGDFTKHSSIITYLNQYSRTNISHSARISYMEYNWDLNEEK